jgi:hypothetical protein
VNSYKFLFVFFVCFQSFLSSEQPVEGTLPGFREFTIPADITFLIADLKYNEWQGVKLCEIQTASVSTFKGYDFLHGEKGLIARLFYDFLSQYQLPIWYISKDICDPTFKKELAASEWMKAKTLQDILSQENFIMAASAPISNPHNLPDYHGIVYVNARRFKSTADFPRQYPGVIFLDASIFPYTQDKYLMNQLLSHPDSPRPLKPQWNLYPKQYSKELVQTILEDITSEWLVIKPRHSTMGQGVIIIHRDDLDGTLESLFCQKSHKFRFNSDSSFRFWTKTKQQNFLVEEFIESDPVRVPHLNNNLYDGTIRVIFSLVYDQEKTHIVFLGGYWKLPKKSISEPGTLTEKHKSFGKEPYFMSVDPSIMEKIEDQLREGLPVIYQQMLQGLKPIKLPQAIRIA